MLKFLRKLTILNYINRQKAIRLDDDVGVIKRFTTIVRGCFDRLECQDIDSCLHIGPLEEYFKTAIAHSLSILYKNSIEFWRGRFAKNEEMTRSFFSNAFEFFRDEEKKAEKKFNLITGVFDGGGLSIDDALNKMKKLLDANGRICILVITRDSPFPLMKIFSRTIREVKSVNIKIQKSFLPQDPRDLRKKMEKVGYREIRAWEDGYAIEFETSEQSFEFVMKHVMGVTDKVLQGNVVGELKESFCRGVESEFEGNKIYGICRFSCAIASI